ncbi:MAG: type II secretion system protein GspK [Kiritimatiellae bacterium]|jgi:general secretion pathway protein K|nr:type II secretion system protein GspK [Kiritimatiellia bacterium]
MDINRYNRITELRSSSGGSALIIALWTISLLSILVMSFALDAMIEGRISTYVRQRRRVDYLTQSGVAIAEMLLEKKDNVSSGSYADDDEDRWKKPALRLKRGQNAVIDEEIEDGVVHVEIIPEEARWNINLLVGSNYDEVWERMFTNAGIPQEYFSELIDCWNDWIDADSTSSSDGAEDDYYKSLEKPYTARNRQIDTVDELLLIKNFGNAILNGGILNPEEENKELQIQVKGIKELFTTYGDGKINVNSAPMGVLMTVPGIDEITAGAIIEEREGVNAGMTTLGRSMSRSSSGSSNDSTGNVSSMDEDEDYSFKSTGDFMSRIPGLDTGVSQFVDTQAKTFRLVIEGRAAGISHKIQAIAEFDGKTVRYLQWREDP